MQVKLHGRVAGRRPRDVAGVGDGHRERLRLAGRPRGRCAAHVVARLPLADPECLDVAVAGDVDVAAALGRRDEMSDPACKALAADQRAGVGAQRVERASGRVDDPHSAGRDDRRTGGDARVVPCGGERVRAKRLYPDP